MYLISYAIFNKSLFLFKSYSFSFGITFLSFMFKVVSPPIKYFFYNFEIDVKYYALKPPESDKIDNFYLSSLKSGEIWS